MKEILHFKDLLPPEFYHEIQGFESRLAVSKLIDVRETLGDCLRSLTYANKNEQDSIEDEVERNIIRRIHLRHAIIDLNNCYDLLLQVPWFFYRVWENFNSKGKYFNLRDKDYIQIDRNTDNWVENAEKDCRETRILKFLNYNSDNDLRLLGKRYNEFKCKFIFNNKKDFTIRNIANLMKHNSALKIKELQKPWKINEPSINQYHNSDKENSVRTIIQGNFWGIEKGEIITSGQVRINYIDDVYIDIQYKDGELFRGIDYAQKNKCYSIDELYEEAEDYYNNIVELYDYTYNNINPKLIKSPILKAENLEIKTEGINIDKYFKIT